MGNAQQRRENTTGWNGFMSIGIPVILGVVALILILNAYTTHKAGKVSGTGTGGDNDQSSPTPNTSSSATPASDLQETYAPKRKKRRY